MTSPNTGPKVPPFTALLHLPLTGPVRFVSDFISGIMQPSVTGKQLEVDAAPRRRNGANQTAFVIQYLDGANEADIVLPRGVQPFGAANSSPIGQGTPFRGPNDADSLYPAFDMTLDPVPNCGDGQQCPSHE